MGPREDVDEGLERVRAACEGAGSLAEFLSITTAALEEHLGYRESAFMLALRDEPRAYAGVKHGSPEYVMEEYFERWADLDPLGSEPAIRAFRRNGLASITEIYDRLEHPRRRFVDDFLRRTHCPHQLSLRIPGAGSDGYVTVMGDREFSAEDHEALQRLGPALVAQLARRLPAGLGAGGDLSYRERQVCELVALGYSNRELGEILHVEEDTVKKHVSRALARLQMRSRTELAVAWMTGRRLDLRTQGARALASAPADPL